MKRLTRPRRLFHQLHKDYSTLHPKVCVVGSGPAGFYATQQIIKAVPNVEVDIIERLPVPFGLVRFGVAPDHPEVKNVINTFTKTAQSPNVRFVGNVTLGTDVKLKDLTEIYNAVLLAYGADEDRKLNIPGEDFKNVLSAREFVGWYNGLPSCKNLAVNLDTECAIVLGQGNVALDVARVLLSPIDALKVTDITEHALQVLSTSKIRRVQVVGRRGPLQVAFTIKELREMINLEHCRTVLNRKHFDGLKNLTTELPRPRKRLTELLLKTALDPDNSVSDSTKSFEPIFLETPLAFKGSDYGTVSGIEFIVNNLEKGDDNPEKWMAVPTKEKIIRDCGLALRSIGYRSVQADPQVPLDMKSGVVCNKDGVVQQGLFVTGWLATGPVGVIVTTMNNAFAVGRIVASEVSKQENNKPGYKVLKEMLDKKGIQIVDFSGWERIDNEEKRRGAEKSKPREKILDVEEMLRIAV